MIENLTICHIVKTAGADTPGAKQDECRLAGQHEDDWHLFETCQRKLHISMTPGICTSGVSMKNVAKGERAYATLLSILCGLESRVIGETEVLGQFKIFISQKTPGEPSWFNQFRRIAQNLILDVKTIRNTYLSSTGHRSYGALTKHHVRGHRNLALIGGGHLARTILPYLGDGTHCTTLFLRDPAKAANLPPALLKDVRVRSLSHTTGLSPVDGLIIAAPLPTRQITDWISDRKLSPRIIVDLRDQGADTPLVPQSKMPPELVTLDDLFAQIEKSSQMFERQISRARKRVLSLTRERFSARHFRPFGWEDICA